MILFFWGIDGEMYMSAENQLYDRVKATCKDGLTQAFWSFGRSIHIDVYEKDRYTSPNWLYKLFNLHIYFDHKYISNEKGELSKSKRYWKIEIYINNYLWISPWSTFKYLWDRFQNNLKHKDYMTAFTPSFNRDWKHRTFEFIVKFLYPIEYSLSNEK